MISFPVSNIVPETRVICKSDHASFLFSLPLVLACNRFDWPPQCIGQSRAHIRAALPLPASCRQARRCARCHTKRQHSTSPASPSPLRWAALWGFVRAVRPAALPPHPLPASPSSRPFSLLRLAVRSGGTSLRWRGRCGLYIDASKRGGLLKGLHRPLRCACGRSPRSGGGSLSIRASSPFAARALLRLLVGLPPALRANRARLARPYSRQNTNQTADQRTHSARAGLTKPVRSRRDCTALCGGHSVPLYW